MIIFIYGPDSWRGQQKVLELKNKFIKEIDQAGNAWSIVEGGNLDLGQLNDLLSSNSLFTAKRLLIVKDVLLAEAKFLNELVEYLPELSASGHIIIFHETKALLKKQRNQNQAMMVDSSGSESRPNKAQQALIQFLQKQQYVQYFAELTNQQAVTWVKDKLAQAKLNIDYQANQLLIALLGNDLWVLNNETDKLIAYKQAQNSSQVVVSDVQVMARGVLDQGIFALTDALSNKNKALAISLLSDQLKLGLSEHYLLAMLVRQFRILLQIRQGLDSGLTTAQLGKQLKVHPYVLQKGINQARNFNLNSLKSIFNTLVKIDFNYKTGRLNVEIMVDLLIVGL